MSNEKTVRSSVAVKFGLYEGVNPTEFYCPDKGAVADWRAPTIPSLIEFKIHQTIFPMKNIYEITILTNVSDEQYPHQHSFSNLYNKYDRPINFSVFLSKGNPYDGFIVEDATVISMKTTPRKINDVEYHGITIVATDTLSYYLSNINPTRPSSATQLSSTIEEIFKKYSPFFEEFDVKVDEAVDTNVQLAFNGEVSIENALDELARTQDLMWCVIGKTLHISKSIYLQSEIEKIHARALGEFTAYPVWMWDDTQDKGITRRMVCGFTSRDNDSIEFYMPWLRPGMTLTTDHKINKWTFYEDVNFLVTDIIHIYGTDNFYRARIEGYVIDEERETNHDFRKFITKGMPNNVKHEFQLEEKMRTYKNAYPSITVGVVKSCSNGQCQIVIGQDLLNRGASSALNDVPDTPLTIDNVPISSLFNEVGSNSPVLPIDTKVLVAFNNNNLNDPVIIGILQNDTGLPYIQLTSSAINIAGSNKSVAYQGADITDLNITMSAVFKTWLQGLAAAAGFATPIPSDQIGYINKGSSKVKVGE
jgi:hypothetical protein